MQYIGVTEQGDAGIDFTWTKKLYDANIIISKHMSQELIKRLVDNYSKIVFHMGCTGYGHTQLEPNNPWPETTHDYAKELVWRGFPISHIVLRIDPIIPTDNGIKTMIRVLDMFKDSGIKRVRYSFMDMYDHVKVRFQQAGIPLMYDTFHAPKQMINNAIKEILRWEYCYQFESCAEFSPEHHKVGCISQKDLDILGVKIDGSPVGFQRKMCMCLSNKKELLSKKRQCANGCLYCYWREDHKN